MVLRREETSRDACIPAKDIACLWYYVLCNESPSVGFRAYFTGIHIEHIYRFRVGSGQTTQCSLVWSGGLFSGSQRATRRLITPILTAQKLTKK